MKRLIILIAIFCIPLGSSAQWDLQIAHGNYDPEVIDTTFRSFDVVDENMIYIYGTEIGPGINDLYYSIFKSIDGGENWIRYQFPLVINTTWSSIAFVNDTLGYIAGWKDAQPGIETPFMRSLLVMRTVDGGENWTEHFVSTEYGIGNSSPVNLDFLADGRCIIVEPGNPGVYISDIERNNWYPLELGSTGHMDVEEGIIALFRSAYCTYSIDAFGSSQTKAVFDHASGQNGDIYISGNDTLLYIVATGQTGWFYGYSQNNYGVISITEISEETLSMSHCLDYFNFADIERISDRTLLISGITYNGYPFLMSPAGSDAVIGPIMSCRRFTTRSMS